MLKNVVFCTFYLINNMASKTIKAIKENATQKIMRDLFFEGRFFIRS